MRGSSRRPGRPLSRVLLTHLLGAAPLAAQVPPGAPIPTEVASRSAVPAERSPAAARWQTARTALQAGDREGALTHLIAALEFHPASVALLLDMVRAAPDDDRLALWGERLLRAASDLQGKWAPDANTRKLLPAGKRWDQTSAASARLAAARSRAVAELGRYADRFKPAAKQANGKRAAVVRWLAGLLLQLTGQAPQLLAAAPNLGPLAAQFPPEIDSVVQALAKLVQRGGGRTSSSAEAGPDDAAVRAARILLGLQQQARFKDLRGPAPKDLGPAIAEAQRVLGALSAPAETKVWTIAELEQLGEQAAVQFTLEHRHWRSPGVALSATGKYRVETICGHETLLGVARTVELHHHRLVAHYGKDPFAERQGLVRIVPEVSDLETEGAPFWWAGGFQSGDRTTLRFAWGDLPGLGRGLTHELTHRFDGVLQPFVGAWFAEGHASWTGGHYAKMADANFVETHLDLGAVARTANKGYGDRARLEQLLRGEVEDYRDNYFAGYTLYAFLRGHPPTANPPPYRAALQKLATTARGGQKDPVAHFAACVCDGKDGRAATFEAFLSAWQQFLRGVVEYLDDKQRGNEWVASYGGLGAPDPAPMVLDEPTFSWARDRAEPFFGQEHASAAAQLLHEVGDRDGALAAGLWALQVDGWRPTTVRAVHTALLQLAPEAAPPFAAVAAERFPEFAPKAPLPQLAQLPALAAYLEALATEAAQLHSTGAPAAAAALAAEHRRLGKQLGAPSLPTLQPLAEHAPPPVPEHLGGSGFAESSLTGYDDRRVPGLWFTTQDGDLHVGREKPRDSTGTMDRASHQRDAFVHTVAWQAPGHYVIRGRIHCTTAYASGALVFGHTRRDRDLRLSFRLGDFRYAIGKDERKGEHHRVHLTLAGLWERDGTLPGAAVGEAIDLPADQYWFDFALAVQGPRVTVSIQGEPRFAYAVHDGAPIEGLVGFAMNMGAIRVQQPTVQRLDANGEPALGLDLDRQPLVPLEDLLQLPTRGLPRQPNGTLVLWLPSTDADAGSPIDGLPRALPTLAKLLSTRHEYPQSWVLAVPRSLSAEHRKEAQERLAELHGAGLPVLEHAIQAPFTGAYPWVLFLDDLGVLRAAAEVGDPKVHSRVQGWSRRFRSRS